METTLDALTRSAKTVLRHPSVDLSAPKGTLAVNNHLVEMRAKRMRKEGVTSKTLKDFVMRLDPDDVFVSGMIFEYGEYEPDETRLFRSLLKGGETVFDVGANIEWYTLNACALGADVHSFEPNPKPFSLLSESVRMNGFSASLFQMCLLDREGSVVPHIPSGTNSGMSSVIVPYPDNIEVPCTTLDKFVESHDITQVDLLKLDVEYAESLALKGALSSISEHKIRNIIMEMSPSCWGGQKTLAHELAEFFDAWVIGSGRMRSIGNILEAVKSVNLYLRARA